VSSTLTYALITPARNEVENLTRLADALAAQTVPPELWLIVDNGSTDETLSVAEELAARHSWIQVTAAGGEGGPIRGGPIVRAFAFGLEQLDDRYDVVVKLDADISMEPDYFERLLAAFAEDPRLGIASGSALEEDADGIWRQRFGTGNAVWGAARAYRRECLQDVLPLEERMGWDGIDEFKAKLNAWNTTTLLDLPFRHHRGEGARDGARWRPWAARGSASHYMGYRFSYLLARAAHHTLREPVAAAMVWGFLAAAIRREQKFPDAEVRARLRRDQRLRNLATRRREALGRTR
jgi:poly-beta-1,6-N-acetyl-D-glucosamine synthase